jgi:glycerophosphoryl diester phosphodiesterase
VADARVREYADDLFGPGSPIRVVGHRGAAAYAPENTLPSFEHAVEVGADAVECDVHCTADGHLVVIHDPTLDRTTNGEGPVETRTLGELRAVEAGYRFSPDRGATYPFRGRGVGIPTLEEVLETVGDLPVIVEIKSARAAEAMGRWLATSRARERIIVGGFGREVVAAAGSEARWRCAYREELVKFVLGGKVGLGRLFAPAGVAAAMVPEKRGAIRVVSRGFVRRAHAAGLGVFVWTVNRPEDMRRLLDWGVDGLISDAPGRARRVLDERSAVGEREAVDGARAVGERAAEEESA